MFADALEDGLLHSNPAAVRVIVRSEKPRRKPPTPKRDDFPRLVDALPERWQLLAVFIGATGVRISEALAVEIDDFDFDSKPARVSIERQHYRGATKRLKTEAGERVLPINAALAAAVREHVERHGHALVFCTLDGKHLQYRNVLRVLNKALREIGVYEHGMAFHSLRRLAASYFEAEGRNDSQIAAVLGHADGGRLARSTYLRPIDGIGDALPDNVIAMPKARSRQQRRTAEIGEAASVADLAR